MRLGLYVHTIQGPKITLSSVCTYNTHICIISHIISKAELYEANQTAEIHIYKDWQAGKEGVSGVKCAMLRYSQKKFSPKLGADLTKFRHDFQVVNPSTSFHATVVLLYLLEICDRIAFLTNFIPVIIFYLHSIQSYVCLSFLLMGTLTTMIVRGAGW